MNETSNVRNGAAPGTAAERRRARARKRLIILGVGCAVLALLVGGILLLNGIAARRAAEEAAAADVQPTIPVDLLPASGSADVLSFVDAAGETVTLVQQEAGLWALDGDAACPVNSVAVQTLYGRLLALKAYRSFLPQEELSGYGLDVPALTVTLTDSAAGESRTLKLGTLNSATSQYYMSVTGSEELYAVSDELYAAFYIRLTDLLVPEALPTFNSNHIAGVTVAAPGAQPLVLLPTGEQQDGVGLWQALQGEESLPVEITTGVTVLDRLASLSYNSMAAWRPDAAALEKMGLDEAQRTAITVAYVVTGEDGVTVSDSLTLYVGGTEAETGGRYAYAEGHGAVYLITAAKVEGLLNATPATLAAADTAA